MRLAKYFHITVDGLCGAAAVFGTISHARGALSSQDRQVAIHLFRGRNLVRRPRKRACRYLAGVANSALPGNASRTSVSNVSVSSQPTQASVIETPYSNELGSAPSFWLPG